MRLLYCYTEFLGGKGEPKPFRGLDKIDLNLSADLIFKYDKEANRLDWGIRKNPLPPGFWANAAAQESERRWAKRGSEGIPEAPADGPAPETAPGPSFPFGELSTNIYNINVVAGRNGTGKSTVINYLIDLLDYVYRDFGTGRCLFPRSARFEIVNDRSILVFEALDEKKGKLLKNYYIIDVQPKRASHTKRVRMPGSGGSAAEVGAGAQLDPKNTFIISNKGRNPRAAESRFFSHLRSLKSIFMTNALTQRDYERGRDMQNKALRGNFIYDCSVGAMVSPDVSQFFLYEVYKQVKYVFDKGQQDIRSGLAEIIKEEFVLPRKLRLWLRYDMLNDFRVSELFSPLNEGVPADAVDAAYHLPQLGIREALGGLCVAANIGNATRTANAKLDPNSIFRRETKGAARDPFDLYSNAVKIIEDMAISAILRQGGGKSIYCITVLPDGRIATGSDDAVIRVFDPKTGECLKMLTGHRKPILCISAFPDGRIVSGSGDNTIRIWDADAGKCVKTLKSFDGVVNCLTALSDDLIVSGSVYGALRVWDVNTGNPVNLLFRHDDKVTCVALLSNGRIVSGSSDKTLCVWDIDDEKTSVELKGHKLSVTCAAALPDGRIVSGSRDGSIRIWDPETGECLKTLLGSFSSVNCVAALQGGRIVGGCADGTLRIWNSETGEFLRMLDGTLRIWNSETGEFLRMLNGHSISVSCVAALPDGRIASGSEDGTIFIWNAETYERERILDPEGRISFIQYLSRNCQSFIRFLRDNEENFNRFRRVPTEECCYETDVRDANDQAGLSAFMTEFIQKYRYTCEPEYTIGFDWGLSSGEQNMLRLFSNLYYVFDRDYSSGRWGDCKIYNRYDPTGEKEYETECDSVLLFLDEADLTLHPEWQRRLIHVLTAFIPGIYPPSCAKDVQIVLSTHSPLLLGDVPKENVYYLGRNSGDPTETFGQNIHTILKDGFFLDHGTVGEFAAARINHTAKRLGEIIKHEKAELYRKKEAGGGSGAAQAETLSGSARGEYVRPDTEELAAIRQTIDLVAEGILRARLESMWLEADALLGPAADSDEVKELLQRIGELSPEGLRQLERGLINAKGANGK